MVTNGWWVPFSLSADELKEMRPETRQSIIQALKEASPWTWTSPHPHVQRETDCVRLSGLHEGRPWSFFANYPDARTCQLLDSLALIVSRSSVAPGFVGFSFSDTSGFSERQRPLGDAEWTERMFRRLPGQTNYHVPANGNASVSDWIQLVQRYDYYRIQKWWIDGDDASVRLIDASLDALPSMPALVLRSSDDVRAARIRPLSFVEPIVVSNRVETRETLHVTYPLPTNATPFCLVCHPTCPLSVLANVALGVEKTGYSPIFVESRWMDRLPSTVILAETDNNRKQE